jgi:HK97 family phage major capsid protein
MLDPRMKATRGLTDPLAKAWASEALKALDRKAFTAGGGAIDVPAPFIGDFGDPERPRYVSDLIPPQPASGTVCVFFQQTTHTNLADAVTAGNAKPESAYGITRVQGPIATIAHLVSGIHRQDLADAAFLAQFIGTQMSRDLAIAIDDSVLNGTGVAPDITGILATSGIGTTAAVTGDYVATVRKAKTSLENLNFVPNALVVNPADSEKLDLTKATGSGDYIFAAAPETGGARSVWGFQVVSTPAIAAGTALLGDFPGGAVLFVRETVRVDWSEAMGFASNTVTARCEARIGLGVLRPHAFNKVTLA